MNNQVTPLDTVLAATSNVIAPFGKELEHGFESMRDSMKEIHVLLAGLNGSGKSAIIDALSGANVVEQMQGTIVTLDYTKYYCKQHGLVLYDAVGIAKGKNTDIYLIPLKRFLEKHMESADSSNEFQVVWYVISGLSDKIDPFEEALLRKLFKDVPLYILISKVDIAAPQNLAKIHKVIDSWNLPNLKAVFEICAKAKANLVAYTTTTKCPRCNSDEVVIKKGKNLFHCDDCTLDLPLSSPTISSDDESKLHGVKLENSLLNVVSSTNESKPFFILRSFLDQRFTRFARCEEQNDAIIKDLFNTLKNSTGANVANNNVATALQKVCVVWNYRRNDLPAFASSLVAKYVHHLSAVERLKSYLKGDKRTLREAVGLVIVFSRCLRKLAVKIVVEFILLTNNSHNNTSSHNAASYIESNYLNWVEEAFAELNNTSLTKIAELLIPPNKLRGYVLKGQDVRTLEQTLENEKQYLKETYDTIKIH